MDSIDKDLLPYGGMMSGQSVISALSEEEKAELKSALDSFEPTPEGLEKIKNTPVVQKFGNDWIEGIKSSIASDQNLLEKWQTVVKTDKAYRLWDSANQLLSETLTERNRAQIQADMPEYETYLPMFGEAGESVLVKLRTFVSSLS